MELQISESHDQGIAVIKSVDFEITVTGEPLRLVHTLLDGQQKLVNMTKTDAGMKYQIDVPEWVYKVLTVLRYDWDRTLAALKKGVTEEVFSSLLTQFTENEQYHKFWIAGIPVTTYNHRNVIILTKIKSQYVLKIKTRDIRVTVPIKEPSLWWMCNIRAHPYKKLGHLMWLAHANNAQIQVNRDKMTPSPEVIHGVLRAVLNKVPFTTAIAMV